MIFYPFAGNLNLGLWNDIFDVVTHFKFYINRFRDFGDLTPVIFSNDHTTVPHCECWLRGTVIERDRRTVPVPRSICSWRVTTYVGTTSAIGQPTRPIQPFILLGSINWIVITFIRCVPVAPSGESYEVEPVRLIQSLCAVCGSNLAGLTLLYIVLTAWRMLFCDCAVWR